MADPKVYWLAVGTVVDDPNANFGWKTTSLNQRWNDDATWQIDNLDSWNELFYPSAHPLNGVSADMAFVITPEPSTVVLLLSGAVAVSFTAGDGGIASEYKEVRKLRRLSWTAVERFLLGRRVGRPPSSLQVVFWDDGSCTVTPSPQVRRCNCGADRVSRRSSGR